MTHTRSDTPDRREYRSGGEAPKERRRLSRKLLFPLLIMLLAVLGISVKLGWPCIRDQVRLADCRSQLRSIGACLHQYADDYAKIFPPELSTLEKNGYLSDHKFFLCPARGTEYRYISGVPFRWDDCPIAFETPGNHLSNRINLLYAEGRVEEITLPESVRSARELLEYLAERTANPDIRQFLRGKMEEL